MSQTNSNDLNSTYFPARNHCKVTPNAGLYAVNQIMFITNPQALQAIADRYRAIAMESDNLYFRFALLQLAEDFDDESIFETEVKSYRRA
jgi:hypothetical protein